MGKTKTIGFCRKVVRKRVISIAHLLESVDRVAPFPLGLLLLQLINRQQQHRSIQVIVLIQSM
ncbi:unnamed protein product [Brassica oleracea var. botrytis]|uniref:Uncharacterized protein n=1 Tax=Brassica oleracea TaxID=3712 RepID=A0A3P6DJ71_BRAOL|nr:unnamed protein product [Brassica oleracea]